MSLKAVHLLYVPTVACNLSCNYCYLGKQTTDASLKLDASRAIDTLDVALKKLEEENIVAFNVSLHGGEVTTLPPPVLEGLFQRINAYYLQNFDAINSLGQKKTNPHIKTNLFKFGSLYELLDKHKVSISASIDLPLQLHAKHRITHKGNSWLEKTMENLKLLAKYPHNKKISATVSAEHLKDTDQFIKDIWFIHNELGFDMNQFNIMFAFPSALNEEKKTTLTLEPVSEQDQVRFYERLHKEFKGTVLEEGLLRHWFDEFKPTYCTNAMNCGEKFYLLQSDGNVYSCVRGQGLPEFHYGNINEQSFSSIMQTGANKIRHIHAQHGLDDDCGSCSHLSTCHTGCAVVKHNTTQAKSYTCSLQKRIYHDHPLSYPSHTAPGGYKVFYMQQILPEKSLPSLTTAKREFVMSSDMLEEKNALLSLIEEDGKLKNIFSPEVFTLNTGDGLVKLESQLLKTSSERHVVAQGEKLEVHFPASLMNDGCDEPVRNTLYVQLLRDTPVVYGDEKRVKQEHLFTYQLHTPSLMQSSWREDYLMLDLGALLQLHAHLFKRGVLNNIFFTTSYLRDYHYNKHKNNAFYHVQTVNLPFQNFEFYYMAKDSSKEYQ